MQWIYSAYRLLYISSTVSCYQCVATTARSRVTVATVVYISRRTRERERKRTERDARTEGSRQKCLCRAVARILRRPNNYIPRVAPRRPSSPRVRVARLAEPCPSSRQPIFHLRTVLPARKISIREAPDCHLRDQSCTPYVLGISIRPSCLRRTRDPTLSRIPLLISRARVLTASPCDVSICAFRANLRKATRVEIYARRVDRCEDETTRYAFVLTVSKKKTMYAKSANIWEMGSINL